MEIKYSLQGLLIYGAMCSYLLAFASILMRKAGAGSFLYLLGFVISTVAYGYRWFDTMHIPLQNLFEVFLFLGFVSYPIAYFCRYFYGVQVGISDMLIGALVLFPAGFVFNARPQHLPPALQSWLFAPHVAAYMLSYMLMAKAASEALCVFVNKDRGSCPGKLAHDQAAHRMVCLGFPLLSLGLLLGSWWGKLAWGDYWGWDPKELWSLASWLVYLGYFHFRHVYGRKYKKINCLWVVVGMLVIIITLLWVNLSNIFSGLHSYAS